MQSNICVILMTLSLARSAPVTRKSVSVLPEAPWIRGCRILINEISLTSPHVFVELSTYCEQGNGAFTNDIELDKYSLVFIDSADNVIGHCHLSGKQRPNGKWYYIVGSDQVQPNFNWKNCQLSEILHGFKRDKPTKYPTIAVALIRNSRLDAHKSLNLYALLPVFFPKKLTPATAKLVFGNLQDFYILQENQLIVIPENFKKIYDQYVDIENHVLKVPSLIRQGESLSRCADNSVEEFTFPMQPRLFQLTTPTPGKLNNCNGEPSSKRRRIECLPLESVSTPVLDTTPEVDPIVFHYNPVDTDVFEDAFSKTDNFFWPDCSLFPKEQIQAMQDLPFSPIDIDVILRPNVCTWIEYLIPNNKFRCKLCNMLLSQRIIYDRKNSPLLTDIIKTGVGRTNTKEQKAAGGNRFENKKFIEDHLDSKMHAMSLRYLKLFKEGKRGMELENAFQNEDIVRSFLASAENVIAAVIQAVYMDLTFNKYVVLTDTLTYFGANVGHLYQTPQGMKLVLTTVANKLHADFVQYLKDKQPEISMSMDLTTDVSGYGIMGVLFQTINANNVLETHLYRLMKLPKGESGKELYNLFITFIEEDGLQSYIKEKLVGLTTDGAPAVRSVFRNLLNQYTDNELIGVWCGAHRMELVASKAFAKFPYLKEVDGFVNDIFSMLTVKSAPRRNEFRNEIANFGERLFEPKRVREFRWLSHHMRALVPFIHRHGILVSSLEKILLRTDGEAQKQNVRDLLAKLKDRSFLMTLAFFADIMVVLTQLSVYYQKRGNTLIGKKASRSKTVASLLALLNEPGEHVTYLLENSEIVGIRNAQLNIEDFENRAVIFDGVEMNTANVIAEENQVHEKMQDYISSVINQLEKYFPPDIVDNMDIFVGSQLELNVENDYEVDKLNELNLKLKWGYDTDQLVDDWKALTDAIITDTEYADMQTKDPEDFWTHFLSDEDIPWTPITNQMIRRCLTIPPTSAEPERVFSIYSYVKTYRRYNLLPTTVESIIRIKFNGMGALKNWDIRKYAQHLILENHSRPDDKSRAKTFKKKKPALEDLEEDEIEALINNRDNDELML